MIAAVTTTRPMANDCGAREVLDRADAVWLMAPVKVVPCSRGVPDFRYADDMRRLVGLAACVC